MPYPPFRRVRTGHDASGRAIITSDDKVYASAFVSPTEPAQDGAFGATYLFRTSSMPESNNATFVDPAGKPMPIIEPDAANWRIIDFPPTPRRRCIGRGAWILLLC